MGNEIIINDATYRVANIIKASVDAGVALKDSYFRIAYLLGLDSDYCRGICWAAEFHLVRGVLAVLGRMGIKTIVPVGWKNKKSRVLGYRDREYFVEETGGGEFDYEIAEEQHGSFLEMF